MNDDQLKKLFREMNHGEPTEMEVARWKRVVRRELIDRTPGEWMRLAVACVIGIVIGAAVFRGKNGVDQQNDEADSTIERVYVNIQ